MKGSYLGPSYDDKEIERYLIKFAAPYEKFDKWIASIILADKTAGAGTFYGRTVRLKNVRFAGHSKKSHDIAAAKLTSKGQRQYDEAIKKGTDEKVAYEAAEKTSKSPFAFR